MDKAQVKNTLKRQLLSLENLTNQCLEFNLKEKTRKELNSLTAFLNGTLKASPFVDEHKDYKAIFMPLEQRLFAIIDTAFRVITLDHFNRSIHSSVKKQFREQIEKITYMNIYHRHKLEND